MFRRGRELRWNEVIGSMRTPGVIALILVGSSISIVGGPHDLTRFGRVWVPNAASPCQVCHQSHGGTPQALTRPLRFLSSRGYLTWYAPVSDRNLACLRCHTRWSVLRQELPDLQGTMPESRLLDFNLTDDHPLDVRVSPLHRGRRRRSPASSRKTACSASPVMNPTTVFIRPSSDDRRPNCAGHVTPTPTPTTAIP